jgi:hypothetical protein
MLATVARGAITAARRWLTGIGCGMVLGGFTHLVRFQVIEHHPQLSCGMRFHFVAELAKFSRR